MDWSNQLFIMDTLPILLMCLHVFSKHWHAIKTILFIAGLTHIAVSLGEPKDFIGLSLLVRVSNVHLEI